MLNKHLIFKQNEFKSLLGFTRAYLSKEEQSKYRGFEEALHHACKNYLEDQNPNKPGLITTDDSLEYSDPSNSIKIDLYLIGING